MPLACQANCRKHAISAQAQQQEVLTMDDAAHQSNKGGGVVKGRVCQQVCSPEAQCESLRQRWWSQPMQRTESSTASTFQSRHLLTLPLVCSAFKLNLFSDARRPAIIACQQSPSKWQFCTHKCSHITCLRLTFAQCSTPCQRIALSQSLRGSVCPCIRTCLAEV